LISLHDRDHAHQQWGQNLRPQIEDILRSSGLSVDGGHIVLLTMPRLFNYVFNPISVYFCYRRDGALAALVHEVSNTFGERHFYALPARVNDGRVHQACEKAFFVSPFLENDLRYVFDVTPPGDSVSVRITVWRDDEVALAASFAGRKRELSDANIFAAWAGNPFMTLKVLIGIHWEALKMLAKGVRYLGRGGVHSLHSSGRASR
jgi:DUF1365 family protein